MDISRITRAIDMNCEYLGVDTLVLMENAGKEIARECKKFDSIAIFCGLGNNGGDGLVAARHLVSIGKSVTVYSLAGERTAASQINFDIIRNLEIDVEFIKDSKDCEKINDGFDRFDLIVDALLGVGSKGELREPIRSIVEIINSAKAFKLSVDIPTPGINPDMTLSLHIKKTEDAKVVDIGIPIESQTYCGPGDVYLALPERKGNEHKGDFGRLLIIGGSKEFIGAPYLVAKAALPLIDLVTIACPDYVAQRLPFDPNMIVNPLDSESYIDKTDIDDILKKDFDAIVVGNGLGTMEDSKYAIKKLIKSVDKPLIIDADALKLIKTKYLRENCILTPHLREFEILFGEIGNQFEDRFDLVERYAKETGTTIVLKGPVDIISNGKETKLNRTGNPGMTVGGTGDILAGIIGALSINSEKCLASCAGTFLCGLAGDLTYNDLGYYFTATDLIERIPDAIRSSQ